MRKQPTFRALPLVSPRNDSEKLNERRNSVLMTCDYPDLGSASDWMEQIFNQSEALPRLLMIVKHVFFFMIRWLCEETTKKMLKMSKKQR